MQRSEFQAKRGNRNKEMLPIKMPGNIHEDILFLISDAQSHLAEK